MEPLLGAFGLIHSGFQSGLQLAMLERVAYCRFQKLSAAFPPHPPITLED
jgi:hypothetical protein